MTFRNNGSIMGLWVVKKSIRPACILFRHFLMIMIICMSLNVRGIARKFAVRLPLSVSESPPPPKVMRALVWVCLVKNTLCEQRPHMTWIFCKALSLYPLCEMRNPQTKMEGFFDQNCLLSTCFRIQGCAFKSGLRKSEQIGQEKILVFKSCWH